MSCCRPVFWPILQTLLACRFGAHVSFLLVVFRAAGRCPDYWGVSLRSAPIVLSGANFTSASARLTSVWIVWIPDRQRRYHHARELAVWSVQDNHFTFETRWSKTYCSFTIAVEQYRRESSAVLMRRTFCYQTSTLVLIRAEETSRVLVWRRQQSLVWCWPVDVVSLISLDADSLSRVHRAAAVLSSSRQRSRLPLLLFYLLFSLLQFPLLVSVGVINSNNFWDTRCV